MTNKPKDEQAKGQSAFLKTRLGDKIVCIIAPIKLLLLIFSLKSKSDQ